jgi:hypothetical protein
MAKRKQKQDSLIVYHGTAAYFQPGISKEGLRPLRESGGVYFTPSLLAAEHYASLWAVGAHILGLAQDVTGLIVSWKIRPDTLVHRESSTDFRLPQGTVPPAQLNFERIDLSALEECERAVALFDLSGVVYWKLDPYTTDEMNHWTSKLKEAVKAIPLEKMQAYLAENARLDYELAQAVFAIEGKHL